MVDDKGELRLGVVAGSHLCIVYLQQVVNWIHDVTFAYM